MELLLEWGADPRKVDPDSVFSTYRLDLIDRFWSAGLDFVEGHALAWHLSEHSSNRPLYGWARRHRDDARIARDLNVGLLHAVHENREKAVHLLLWAGADPRARVPDLRWISSPEDEDEDEWSSAIQEAASHHLGSLLPLFKPHPARDDFAALYATAEGVATLKHLVATQPPTDWTPAILKNIHRLRWPFGDHCDAKACLDFIASQGGRLGRLTPDQCADLRSCLLKLAEADTQKILVWLSAPDCCDPTTHAEITRTGAMRARLRQIRKESERQRRRW